MSTNDLLGVIFFIFIGAPAISSIIVGALDFSLGILEHFLPPLSPPPPRPAPPVWIPSPEIKLKAEWCPICKKETLQPRGQCQQCFKYPDQFWRDLLDD